MAVTPELLIKIQSYEKQGYRPEEIMAGIKASGKYNDIAAKIDAYGADGYNPSDILAGIKKSPVTANSEWRTGTGAKAGVTQADFLRDEGTAGTKLRQSFKDTPAMDYVKEPARFAAETALMPLNALGRGLKSVASTVQGGGEAIRQGSIDAGLQRYQQKQAEFQPIQSPMAPSAMGNMIAAGAQKGINKLSDLTGRPDIVEPVAQGAMDIGALAGLRSAVKGGSNAIANRPVREPALPSQKSLRSAELANLSEQYNVPLTVGELRESTGIKAAETQLERVPAVGIRGFREKQSAALKDAATSLVDSMTTGVDDSGVAIQQSLLNKLQKGKDLSRQAYNQIDEAMTRKGVVDEIQPTGTREAAKQLLAEYPDIFDRLPSGTVKSKLQIITEDTAPQQRAFEGLTPEGATGGHGRPKPAAIVDAQGLPITTTVQPKMSFKDARALREQLGNYIDRAYKSAGAVGGKELRQLSILKSALDGDINAWAEGSPHIEINKAFRNANKVYQNNVAPFKDFIIKKATGDAFDTDLMAKTFIKNDRPQLAGKLMGLLDDSGKAAVKHSILKEALDLGLDVKADVPFSPAKFANKLERYGNTLTTIFSKEELGQINGFVKLARAAERAGQYAENPPTGLRAGDLGIFTGFGYGIATNPLATLGTAAALKSLSTMLTSDFGRKLLTQSSKIKEGTPQWNNFLRFANEKALITNKKEQP